MAEAKDKGAKAPKAKDSSPKGGGKPEPKGRGKPTQVETAAADVTFLVSLTASPMPMLSTIFSSFGTSSLFL